MTTDTIESKPMPVPALLRWFQGEARDLPWRRTLNPYAIWVSEIMLQQTQVKTVWPFWERWMREFPDVCSLARAEPARVLKLWEGLGYYTRARNLQRAAQAIVENQNGEFPIQFEELLALPGIGRYTAGAIASIAFNQPRPILDGNVIRILTRFYGIRGDPAEKKTNQRLWRLAEELIGIARKLKAPARRAAMVFSGACSILNQAMMELGALICTPRSPACGRCPIADECVARRRNLIDKIPKLAPRARVTARHYIAFAIRHGDRVLVRRRPTGVINAHLWEFPNIETAGKLGSERAWGRRELGFDPGQLTPLSILKHSITRYRISVRAFQGRVKRPPRKTPENWEWFSPAELDGLAFTSAHRKILRRFNSSEV